MSGPWQLEATWCLQWQHEYRLVAIEAMLYCRIFSARRRSFLKFFPFFFSYLRFWCKEGFKRMTEFQVTTWTKSRKLCNLLLKYKKEKKEWPYQIKLSCLRKFFSLHLGNETSHSKSFHLLVFSFIFRTRVVFLLSSSGDYSHRLFSIRGL